MSNKSHITSVGGQALIEGVMMRGPKGVATAIRKPDNSICVENHEVKYLKDKCKFFGIPIIRGIVAFFESMVLGYKMLMHSAEVSGMEDLEDVEMNKFEKWVSDKLGDKFMDFIMGFASVLGFILAFVIFFYLPVFFFNKLNAWCDFRLTPWQGTIEGVTKIVVFVIYMILVSQMNDVKRLFKYHGAEHKSIACYEKGEELTVENVKKCTRFHPRCGTSFMFAMLILSIFVVTLFSLIVPTELKQNTVVWMCIKLPLIPIIMGIGYEFIKYAGKHNNLFVKIISAPGLWMQRITTKEPDDDIIEVGIESLKAVITDNIEDDEIK